MSEKDDFEKEVHESAEEEQSSPNSSGESDSKEESTNEDMFDPFVGAYDHSKDGERASQNKHFQRIGFFCAIEPDGEPEEDFKKANADLEEQTKIRIKQYEDRYQQTLEYVSSKLRLAKERLREEKKALANHQGETEALKEEHLNILAELAQIKKKMNQAYVELANARQQFIDKHTKARFIDIEEEIKKLIDNFQILAEKKHKINLNNYNKNKTVYDEKVKRFSRLREQVEKSYQPIRHKVAQLAEMGFTPITANFLVYVGTAALFATGWFYSAFAISRRMESEDTFTFVIRRIIYFGDSQFSQGQTLSKLFGFIGVWFGILAMIALVIWLCRKIIERSGVPWVRTDLQLSFSEEGGFSAARIRTKSIFSMWMEVLPILFAVGVGFILLSLFGPAGNDVEKLFKSMSGQLIGTLIALVATGIIAIYITLIIEPRLFRNFSKNKSTSKLWKKNWELLFIIGLFSVVMFSIVIYSVLVQPESPPIDSVQQTTPQVAGTTPTVSGQTTANQKGFVPSRMDPTLALASFIVTLMFTGFTLGYGIRYRGLYREKEYVETILKNLANAIESNSRPKLLDLQSIEPNRFREKLEKCLFDFLEIIRLRNRTIKELFSNRVIKTTKVPLRGLFRRLPLGRKENLPVLEMREVTTAEEKYFPQYTNKIEDLKTEWSEKKRELEAVDAKIHKIENQQNDLGAAITKRIDGLESSIRNYEKEKIKHKKRFDQNRDRTIYEKQTNVTALREGFNLGMWYRKNEFGTFKQERKAGSKS